MEVEPSRLRRRGGTYFAARRAARELGARERARVHLCHAVPRKVIARELWVVIFIINNRFAH